jgi:hypothetical protein
MLLGRRKGSGRFDVHQIDVHADLFEDVRAICRAALTELDRREAKPYFPFGTATTDDYLEVDVSEVPQRVDARKKPGASSEPAAALTLVAGTDTYDSLTASELRTTSLTMYAFVFKTDEGYVGFIRNTNPHRRVTPGVRFLKFENALRRMDPPDIAIDDAIDLVVTPEKIAILAVGAFNTLFGDVKVVFQQVPSNANAVRDALASSLPLSQSSQRVLVERCGRRVIDAKRLNHIATERLDALAALEKGRLREILKQRGLAGAIRKGGLEINDETVSDFLDAIEGRLFSDDVTGEDRRADAYSPRRSK